MKQAHRIKKVIPGENPSSLAINLRHLRTLSAVAAAGSIAAASETMCRVSSAITRSIGELEGALGTALFERHARGMELNGHGRSVLQRARQIDAEFDAAARQLVQSGGTAALGDVAATFATILNGRKLAVVASLAEQGNMAVVAREFGLTQPAVSSALKDIETGLGARLFDRSPRGLSPTVAGDIVAFFFKRILAELRHLLADIAGVEGELSGTVHVGALPLGRTHVLPQAIASLLARHPALHVTTIESPYDALAATLRNGDIDFILGALRDGDDARDLDQEPLFADRLSLIARAGHPLARSGGIDIDRLQDASWVLSRHGSPSRELLVRFFESAGHRPPLPAVETGDLGILRGLLLESDMVTAISAHQLRYEITNGCLVVLDFSLERTRRQIGICQRAGALPSAGARALMDEIRTVVAGSPLFADRPGEGVRTSREIDELVTV